MCATALLLSQSCTMCVVFYRVARCRLHQSPPTECLLLQVILIILFWHTCNHAGWEISSRCMVSNLPATNEHRGTLFHVLLFFFRHYQNFWVLISNVCANWARSMQCTRVRRITHDLIFVFCLFFFNHSKYI